MIVGWSWEWPPPRCAATVPHKWVWCEFRVSGYEPGVTRTVVWWRCRECYARKEMEAAP